jgi:hypothetical protein
MSHLFLEVYLGRVYLSTGYLLRVELHYPGPTRAIDHHDHIVGGGHVDYVAEVADFVEGTLVEAGQCSGGTGKDENVIIAGSALGNGAVDRYFLRERVCLLVILSEEMIIVS